MVWEFKICFIAVVSRASNESDTHTDDGSFKSIYNQYFLVQIFVPATYAYEPKHISDSWKTAISAITRHPTPHVLICGSRNVGKSTFARLLINRLLNQ